MFGFGEGFDTRGNQHFLASRLHVFVDRAACAGELLEEVDAEAPVGEYVGVHEFFGALFDILHAKKFGGCTN